MGYLDELGVLPPSEDAGTAVDRLLGEFRRYLLEERALTVGSVELYESVARLFLAGRSEPIAEDLARLSAAEVITFVLRESRRRGRASALTMVCALRALLRFLHVQGWIAAPLATAVPSIPRRREDLPRGIAAGRVQRLLDSCDRATGVGRRDFAILTLLARLGLRRGEVAGLGLDNLDWRAGELVIHGKGTRLDRLPLPGDVGEALAEYLRCGRQAGFGRTLFLRSCAPITGLSSAAVSSVVVRACERAGIPPVGAHALRHTLASELLRRGASLPEIVSRAARRDSYHRQLGARVRHPAAERQRRVVASATGDRPRLRAVSAGVRFAHRGAARGPATGEVCSRGPLPVFRGGNRGADGSSPQDPLGVEGRHLRDADRALGGQRHASRRGDRARP